MKKVAVSSFITLILVGIVSFPLAAEITSVRPRQVLPGDNLYITLSRNATAATVLIGTQPLAAEVSETGLVYYPVPYLPPGEYSLQLQVDGEVTPSDFRITVLELTPVVEAIEPGNIPECAEIIEKTVNVKGRNFLPESRLLVNGALVESTAVSSQLIRFDASPLRSDAHGVQVVNPSGTKSVPFSLYVNNVPMIEDVTTGDYFTNHYELVIRGGNFFQQSTLLVTETPAGMTGVRPRQKVVWGQGRRVSPDNLLDQEAEDYLFYEDCNTLVYYRFPVSGQAREMTLKVINPDGKASGAYRLLAN
ncbi:MAG: hypothetical protein GWN87_02840 [Desulfuromonadales bacterium]|nr:hypothetical protein [Desulfuromonadales bacterium]